MADQDGPGDEPLKKGLNPIRLALALGLLSLIILVIGGGLWFLFPNLLSGSLSLDNGAVEESEVVETIEVVGPDRGTGFEDIIRLDLFERVPLNGKSLMKSVDMELALELMAPKFRRQVGMKEERIRNIVIGQCRQMRWMELRNVEGKLKLKYALIDRINSVFSKTVVRNIYILNFRMQ